MRAVQEHGADFAAALRSLHELADRPIYTEVHRATKVPTSTYSNWMTRKAVPDKPELLASVVRFLRLRVVAQKLETRFTPEQAARFAQLTEAHLEQRRAAAALPGAGSLELLRRLTVQAVDDLRLVVEPNERFRRGVRLEDLYVRRDLEHLVLEAVPNRCAQLIAGQPGSGKSSVLWNLQRILARQPRLEALFVKATYLLDGVRPGAADLPTAVTVAQIEEATRYCQANGQTPVLLVDTLDLLVHSEPGRQAVAHLLKAMQRVQVAVVMSCRPGEAAQLPFDNHDADDAADLGLPLPPSGPRTGPDGYLRPQLKLDWYSPRERKEAIARHSQAFCPDRLYGTGATTRLEDDIAEAVYRGLPLAEVCNNPLYLRLLFDIYAPDPPVKNIDVTSLFTALRRRRLIRDVRAGQEKTAQHPQAARNLETTARALARYMLAANTLEVDLDDEGHHLEALLPDMSWEEICADVDELRRRGLVAAVPHTSSVRFFHQTFFEYMVADYLWASHRGQELVDRLLKYPDDLVLAAVAGQLVPRLKPGAADTLLTPLLHDDRLAATGIEFYALLRTPGKVSAAARTVMHSLPPETLKRFLRVLPAHRHRRPERWRGDLTTVWTITGADGYRGAKPVRLQMFDTLRRLLPQHPDTAIDFLDTAGCLTWLIDLPADELAAHKDTALDLLRAAFAHDTDKALEWLADVCRKMIAAGKYEVAADAVRAAAHEARRARDPHKRAQQWGAALDCFQELLAHREPGSKKSLYLEPVEQAVGTLWAAHHARLPHDELLAAVSSVLATDLTHSLQRARLHGTSIASQQLNDRAAQRVISTLVDLPTAAAQTAAKDHVLVPALRNSGDSPFEQHLRSACRDALGQLPAPAYEEGRRRHSPAFWFADALAAAQPSPHILLQLLPDDAPARVWLDRNGLARLVVPAAVAGHNMAQHALEQWSSNAEVRSEPATAAAHGSIRAPFTAMTGDHPQLLRYLIAEATLLNRTSLLTTAVEAIGNSGSRPLLADTRRLRKLTDTLCNSTDKGRRREGYRLRRALIDHAGWAPPPPAELLDILTATLPGQPLHTVAVQTAIAAARSGHWTYPQTCPLLEHLTRLCAADRQDGGRNNGAHLIRRAVATIWGRLGPIATPEERDLALRTTLALVLPEGGSMHTYDSDDVRELGRLLQRMTAAAPAEAARGLQTMSTRLRSYTAQNEGRTNDLAVRLVTLLVELLDRLGPSARRQLVTGLAVGEAALARKAVEIFAQAHEVSLTTPPKWFRDLAHDKDLPTAVRHTITARLRIHARMQCGEFWPELQDDPAPAPAAV
ncbi:hypothetical protein [Streptomyces fungicidicus]|uniref:hypothetical protein n=1 Tax=Streptomyces fungicidicus TaxID=68203 RepID=UPI0037FAAACD